MVSPLEFLTTTVPSTGPSRTFPDDVETSASPATSSTVTWPTEVSTRSGPVRSRLTFPAAVLNRDCPSCPVLWNAPACTSAAIREPAGSSTVTSTERVLREKSNARIFGPVTCSMPLL